MGRYRKCIRILADPFSGEDERDEALRHLQHDVGRLLPYRLARKLLREVEEPFRNVVVFALRIVGTPRLSPELRAIAANQTEIVETRTAALEVLGHYPSRKNRRFLLSCLGAPEAPIRYWAAEALYLTGDESCLAKLDELASSDHEIAKEFWHREFVYGPVSEPASKASEMIRKKLSGEW